MNGVRHILKKTEQTSHLSSVAKIVLLPEKKQLRVLCENGLQVIIVRGTKVLINDYQVTFIKSIEHYKHS